MYLIYKKIKRFFKNKKRLKFLHMTGWMTSQISRTSVSARGINLPLASGKVELTTSKVQVNELTWTHVCIGPCYEITSVQHLVHIIIFCRAFYSWKKIGKILTNCDKFSNLNQQQPDYIIINYSSDRPTWNWGFSFNNKLWLMVIDNYCN